MRLTVISATIATLILPVEANAQITIQMANIRCDQYLAMPSSDSERFSAWMSGWFSYQNRTPWVDLLAYRQNVASYRRILVTGGSGGSSLSLRSDDLDSVVELYTANDFRQLVVAAQTMPTLLGGLRELEDHSECGLVREATP
jgi:hypothetical protein